MAVVVWITYPKHQKIGPVLEAIMEGGADAKAASKNGNLRAAHDGCSSAVSGITVATATEFEKLFDIIKEKLYGLRFQFMSLVMKDNATGATSWAAGNYVQKDSDDHKLIVDAISALITDNLDIETIKQSLQSTKKTTPEPKEEELQEKEEKEEEEEEEEEEVDDGEAVTIDLGTARRIEKVLESTMPISDSFFTQDKTQRTIVLQELRKAMNR